jgi:hypothetical protein
MFSWPANLPESHQKVTPGIQSFLIERLMRLPRSFWRERETASAISAPAAINNAPPMASAPRWSGPEDSGGGATVFADVIGLGGEVERGFAGVTGAALVGANEVAGGAGAVFI